MCPGNLSGRAFWCTDPVRSHFFIDAHRRDEVLLSQELREQTWQTAKEIADMIERQKLVPAGYSVKCKKCSLREACQPKIRHSALSYSDGLWDEAVKEME